MPYNFTLDDYRKFTEDIIKTEGDQATLTTILADMQDTFTDNIALVESERSEREKLSKENTRLKESNMSLFLRVGAQARGEDNTPPEEEKTQTVSEYMTKYLEQLDK